MSMSPLEELRHSASHVLATAVLRLFPEAKLDIGPPTDSGFYYDIDLDHKFTADDLVKLEAEMKKIADENQPFYRKEVSREEAIEIIKSHGQERYKMGRLADIPADEVPDDGRAGGHHHRELDEPRWKGQSEDAAHECTGERRSREATCERDGQVAAVEKRAVDVADEQRGRAHGEGAHRITPPGGQHEDEHHAAAEARERGEQAGDEAEGRECQGSSS